MKRAGAARNFSRHPPQQKYQVRPPTSAWWRAPATSTVIPQTGIALLADRHHGKTRRRAGRLGRGRAAHAHDFRQDRDRDLLRRTRADVEAGGTLDPREGLRIGSARGERRADLAEAFRARDDPEVVRIGRQGRADRGLVALAHRRDDREGPAARQDQRRVGIGPEPLGAGEGVRLRRRIGDVHRVAHRPADARERLRHGRDSEDEKPRRRQDRFDVDVHGASTVAGHRKDHDPGTSFGLRVGREGDQARHAVGDRLERLADHGRLRAASPEPAVEGAVGRDERAVARLRARGRLPPDDRGEGEGLLLRHEPARERKEVGAHGTTRLRTRGGARRPPGSRDPRASRPATRPRPPPHGGA